MIAGASASCGIVRRAAPPSSEDAGAIGRKLMEFDVTLADIEAAAKRIAGRVRRTPTYVSPALSERLRRDRRQVRGAAGRRLLQGPRLLQQAPLPDRRRAPARRRHDVRRQSCDRCQPCRGTPRHRRARPHAEGDACLQYRPDQGGGRQYRALRGRGGSLRRPRPTERPAAPSSTPMTTRSSLPATARSDWRCWTMVGL
jgi:hypothetical protein